MPKRGRANCRRSGAIGEIAKSSYSGAKSIDKELLNLIACPLLLTQELERGLNGWVDLKAVNIDAITEFIPAVVVYEALNDIGEFDTVKCAHTKSRFLTISINQCVTGLE